MRPVDPDIQKRIANTRWYHEFDFGDGLVTEPEIAYRDVWKPIEHLLDGVDFAKKSVLDIGCWDGYWSFYCERRGAASVLAIDREDQRWGGSEGFRIAHEIYESQVSYRNDVNVYDLRQLL